MSAKAEKRRLRRLKARNNNPKPGWGPGVVEPVRTKGTGWTVNLPPTKKTRQRGQANKADRLVVALGGKGSNLASGASDTPEGVKEALRVPGTEDQMPVVATLNDRSLAVLSAGIVLAAIRQGWMTAIKDGENPFYAFKYMFNVFVAALNQAPPLNTGAPVWFWEILAAIKPKFGSFKTGKVAYSWKVNPSDFPVQPIWQYAAIPGRYICWGTPSSTLIDDFPVITPAIDTDDQSILAASFTSMCKYLATTDVNQIVPGVANPLLEGDTSSFSVTFPELGQSLNTAGALALTIYSERNINCPIMAKFAEYQPSGENYRGWHKAGKSALSACYIGPRMMEFKKMNEAFDKVSPILAIYNFDEFFYSLSLTLATALKFTQDSITSNAAQCPLTSQEVQILLRQAMLPFFRNDMVQDIYLGVAPLDLLVPFCVGPNGVAQAGGKMMLPTVLAENIKCCQRKVKGLPGLKGKMSAFDIVTVLTRPSNQDQLDNFFLPDTEQLLYAPAKPQVINIIDMSAVVGNSTFYLTATGEIYDMKIAAFNEWITQLAGALSPLVQLGTEPGISVLQTSLFTRSIVNNTEEFKQAKLVKTNSQKKIVKPLSQLEAARIRFKKVIPGPSTPVYLQAFVEKEIIANQPPAGPIWTYLSQFILPVLMTESETLQASVQTWKTFQIQPYTIVANTIAGGAGNVSPENFPRVTSRLAELAAWDNKSINQQQPSEAVLQIVEATKRGAGGFFASLAGMAADVFVPGAGQLVRGVADSIGL